MARKASTTPKADLPSVLSSLDEALAKHRPDFLPALRKPVRSPDLKALAEALGGTVPDDLATLLRWHDGQADDPPLGFLESFYLLRAKSILSTHAELVADPPDGWDAAWVPFLADDQGDYVCLDPNKVRAVWSGKKRHPAVAASLADYLAEYVKGMVAGEYHLDEERGGYHRRT